MREQREDRVRDQAHGRLVPRDDQQDHHAEELVLLQAVALLLGLEEGAHEVVARVGAALLEELGEVGEELLRVPEEQLDRVLSQRGADEGVRPDAEAVSILGRDAEQLGDDDDREREREAVHEVRFRLAARLMSSMSSSAISWMRGRSCSTILGVNALATRRRRRRWSSPSVVRTCG